MTLAMATMGTERIAPGMPHIQNQKTSEMMTMTGLRVNRPTNEIVQYPKVVNIAQTPLRMIPTLGPAGLSAL
jgi:hypothetical protein